MFAEAHLCLDSANELVAQRSQPLRLDRQMITLEKWVAKSVLHLTSQLSRPGAVVVVGVVRSPVDELTSVERGRGKRLRHIDDRDPSSGPTEYVPKRLARDLAR